MVTGTCATRRRRRGIRSGTGPDARLHRLCLQPATASTLLLPVRAFSGLFRPLRCRLSLLRYFLSLEPDSMRPTRVLCVAEKPSIAKSITQILSGGQSTTVRCNLHIFVVLTL